MISLGNLRVSLAAAAFAAAVLVPGTSFAQAGGVVGGSGSAGGGNSNQDAPDVGALIKVFMDDSAKPPEREKAILEAMKAVWRMQDPATRDKSGLKEAALTLLEKLQAKMQDPSLTKLTSLSFSALEPFKPLPEVASRARPFIEKGPPLAQQGAINAVARHIAAFPKGEVSSFTKDFLRILDECAADEAKFDQKRGEALERPIIEAALLFPPDDKARTSEILVRALEKSTRRETRQYAVRYLGDLKDQRAIPALKKAAAPTELTVEIACEAATALTHCGDNSGIESLIERFENGGGNLDVYRALCTLSYHLPDGFAGVPVEKFNRVGMAKFGDIQREMRSWWSLTKGRDHDQLIYEQLSQKGVAVPKDLNSAEIITALIDGLDVEPRSLRYDCLDILVRKLARASFFAKDFKTINTQLGPGMMTNEEEPASGFTDSKKREELAKTQKLKASKVREWWQQNKSKAKQENGVWTVPGDDDKK